MKPKIDFVLRDIVDGAEVTPATIELSRFNSFNNQVEEFIAGAERLKLEQVHVKVSDGSYKLTVFLSTLVAASLSHDLAILQQQDSLGEIDPVRAAIVQKWQSQAKTNPNLHYGIRPHGLDAKPVVLSASTDYRTGEVVPWVKVEKYLFGTIVDMGGATKANVHVRLDDSGQVVRVGTNQDYLRDQTQNRLYQKMLLRVEAEQHYRTGNLRNLRLISFEDYQPGYDEDALDRFAEVGRRAWADVPDAAQWVRQLRGEN